MQLPDPDSQAPMRRARTPNTLLQQWARLARAVLCTDRDDRDHLLQASVRTAQVTPDIDVRIPTPRRAHADV